MPRVAVRILHLEPDEDTGELTRLVAEARRIVADDLCERFRGLGAGDVRIATDRPGRRTFGARLRELAAGLDGGLVVLGSGSIPLASDAHLAGLVDAAASGRAAALTNNRYSSDVVALGDASRLADVPDLPGDNALPRWLERVGLTVEELPDRDRLAMDVDSPLDVELLTRHPACPPALAGLTRTLGETVAPVSAALDRLAALARDSAAELLVAGRLSASTLARLERGTACRVRALVEERGLRASAALPGDPVGTGARPPASALGILLDQGGPGSLGTVVARLADGAALDTRVLLAHRLGVDERAWPPPEDRFASDLLLAERVGDPWLRELTATAASATTPIVLGGHSLVGPGLGLALRLGDD